MGTPRQLCPPLDRPSSISVDVADVASLVAAVRAATPGTAVLLADGTYALGGQILQLKVADVTLRSKSGNREAVVLDGQWNATSGEVVSVTANGATISDLTIAHAYTHAIHVQSTDAGDVVGTTIYNVHIVDALEQAIKINFNAAMSHFADLGTVACSHLELTATGRPMVRNNCYTGGIDAHGASDWQIRDNVIEGFYCAHGLSEHGIHFWTGSRKTLVERNRIFNSARGVGFGLGETTASSTDAWRTYPDEVLCPGTPVGHYGGIVRNNFIFASDAALFASDSGFDSGIALEQACNATIVHNTVFGTKPPLSSAIEWRFANTTVTATNNLANAAFKNRGGGPQEEVAGNIATATAAFFVDAAAGDLHLARGDNPAHGTGAPVSNAVCDEDIDRDVRTTRDVGADQIP